MSALCTVAYVINRISTGGLRVRGVASVDDELFALLQRDYNQVAVYSTSDYKLLRYLDVPGYKPNSDCDMTACVQRKCLYIIMSDGSSCCILRYALADGATSRWSLPRGSCVGLSVTPTGNLLATCRSPNKLVELSADSGAKVREIAIQEDIKTPHHGVKLVDGQFVVCHGAFRIHRMRMVDDDFTVTGSYGGLFRLTRPRQLAVDEHSELIFVADMGNDRVVVLTPKLEFVRYIQKGLSNPQRLYLDQPTRRLYAAQSRGDVVVIQL